MTLPYLTQLPGTALKISGLSAAIAFFLVDSISGLNAGVVGAITGAIVAVLGTVLSHIRQKQALRTSGAVTIDQERDKLMERADKLQQQERDFMQRQVNYHERLEMVARQRLHAIIGEVQRCVLHIRTIDGFLVEHQFTPPPFTVKNFDDIVEMYPLPKPPEIPDTVKSTS
jgi:hypothetical protein